jgi:predicted nucleotidyltransferase component of viral defense system
VKPDDLAKSVRQRLLNVAAETGEDYNLLLVRYVGMRFLYRLSQSPHAKEFVLKGATMFLAWFGAAHRPTKDIDLLSLVIDDQTKLDEIFKSVASMDVGPDGVTFEPNTMQMREIREDQWYGGVRVKLIGIVGSARIPIQIDVGYGDVITPGVVQIELPNVLKGIPGVSMSGYPIETAVAEKFEALVKLGILTSRMKDLDDLLVMIRSACFDGESLTIALHATFHRRKTGLPATASEVLSEEFVSDAQIRRRWTAFSNKNARDERIPLDEVCSELRSFFEPILQSSARGVGFSESWHYPAWSHSPSG